MSSVFRASYTPVSERVTQEKLKEILGQRKWKTVDIKISQEDLEENIWLEKPKSIES